MRLSVIASVIVSVIASVIGGINLTEQDNFSPVTLEQSRLSSSGT